MRVIVLSMHGTAASIPFLIMEMENRLNRALDGRADEPGIVLSSAYPRFSSESDEQKSREAQNTGYSHLCGVFWATAAGFLGPLQQ